MITSRIGISIACPAAQVFARLSDFEKNPTWQNGVKFCTWITDSLLRIGSRYDQKAQFSGCDINSVSGSIEYEPGRRVRAATVRGSFPIAFTRWVETIDDSTTRVQAVIEGDSTGLFRFLEAVMAPMVRRSIRKDYERLKVLLESWPGECPVAAAGWLDETRRVFVRRWRLDGIRFLTGSALLLVAMTAATDPAPAWEVSLFEAINRLPRGLDWVLWPFTQAGNVLAFVAAGALLWFLVRHWQPPVALVTVGTVVGWLGAKVVKELAGRGRPDALVAGVEFAFGASIGGLGFPSGHVVVAFTIAVVFSPYLARPARWALYGVGGVVALARVHTGAHMPLDVIGGMGFGVALGSLVCLLAGVVAAKARPGSLALDRVGTD